MIKIKICCICKEEKPICRFVKRSRSKDGLARECKECTKKYHAVYREKNRKRIASYKAQYLISNKDKVLEYRLNNKDYIAKQRASYRARNKDVSKRNWDDYYSKNKERVAERNREYRGTLSDGYVCDTIVQITGLSRDEIYKHPTLIELKRKQLKLKRIKRQLINN